MKNLLSLSILAFALFLTVPAEASFTNSSVTVELVKNKCDKCGKKDCDKKCEEKAEAKSCCAAKKETESKAEGKACCSKEKKTETKACCTAKKEQK
ncbi:MAG: hypothetical protein N4A46_00380 [Schleiferiaceae bacterium]|nr:hypothetical protein [Schleiferiaceae bacterium]